MFIILSSGMLVIIGGIVYAIIGILISRYLLASTISEINEEMIVNDDLAIAGVMVVIFWPVIASFIVCAGILISVGWIGRQISKVLVFFLVSKAPRHRNED